MTLFMMKIKQMIAAALILNSTAWANPIPTTANLTSNSIRLVTRPEIVGLWGMTIPKNKKCTEYYNFKTNNEVIIKSANEWSYGIYDYQSSIEVAAPLLTLNIRYDNNQVDCSGVQEDQSGEISHFSVQWKNPHTIEFCHEDNPKDCFATLRRILP